MVEGQGTPRMAMASLKTEREEQLPIAIKALKVCTHTLINIVNYLYVTLRVHMHSLLTVDSA